MWYTVDIHTCGHYAINIELEEAEKERLLSEWEEARREFHFSVQRYEGRWGDDVRVDPRQDENGRPLYNYENKYVSACVKIDLAEVVAIEVRETVEQGE